MTASTRQQLHELIAQLPASELPAAARFLQYLRDTAPALEDDPVLRAFLEAPDDDEMLTPEDDAAIAEGEAAVARGDVEPFTPRVPLP
jgi:hypothetical protein